MPAQLFDQRNMAHAQPQQKSIGIGLRQRFLPGRHRHRVARIDVRDSGGDHHSLRRRQQQARVGQHFSPGCFAKPESPVSQLLQLASGLLCLRGGLIL